MDEHSNLNASLLSNKCGECINHLNADISDQESVFNKLQEVFAEQNLVGKGFEAFKNQLTDYYTVNKLSISADEQDIADFTTLQGYATQSYIGSIIVPSYLSAKKEYEENSHKAAMERLKAAAFNTIVVTIVNGILHKTTISNPYEASAKAYQQAADDAEKEMIKWKTKMDEFDAIEAATSGLFESGQAVRECVKSILDSMQKQSITGFYDKAVAVNTLKENGEDDILNQLLMDEDYIDFVLANSPEYALYLKNLKDIEKYREMMLHVPSSEVNKIQDEIDRLLDENDQLMVDMFKDMEHGEDITSALKYLRESGMSDADLSNLMGYWLLVGDMDSIEGYELPPDLLKQVNTEINVIKWKMEGNYAAAINQYYNGGVADFIVVMGMLDGKDLSTIQLRVDYIGDYFDEEILGSLPQYIKDALSAEYDDALVLVALLKLAAVEVGGESILNGLVDLAELEWKGIDALLNKIGVNSTKVDQTIEELEAFSSDEWNSIVEQLKIALHYMPGSDVNDAYNLLSRLSINTIDPQMVEDHYNANINGWNKYSTIVGALVDVHGDGNKFIEHQGWFYTDIYYGKYVGDLNITNNFMLKYYDQNNPGAGLYGAGNTCEIIATYNVLTHLGEDVYFPDIIKDFEENAPILGGNYGSAPDQYEGYVQAYGYETIEYTVEDMEYKPGSEDDYSKMLEECDAIIISEWNGDGPNDGMHTMAITIDKTKTDANGDPIYQIVRHNDSNKVPIVDSNGNYVYNAKGEQQFDYLGYTEETDKDGLYKLINEYSDGNPGSPLKVLGIVKMD